MQQTPIPPELCGHAWPLDESERVGRTPYAVEGLEHICADDLEHAGAHICACGAAS